MSAKSLLSDATFSQLVAQAVQRAHHQPARAQRVSRTCSHLKIDRKRAYHDSFCLRMARHLHHVQAGLSYQAPQTKHALRVVQRVVNASVQKQINACFVPEAGAFFGIRAFQWMLLPVYVMGQPSTLRTLWHGSAIRQLPFVIVSGYISAPV